MKLEIKIPDGKLCNGCPFIPENNTTGGCSLFDTDIPVTNRGEQFKPHYCVPDNIKYIHKDIKVLP